MEISASQARPPRRDKGKERDSGKSAPKATICYNCRQEGHKRAACPHPQKPPARCARCGQEGHYKNRCRTDMRNQTKQGTQAAAGNKAKTGTQWAKKSPPTTTRWQAKTSAVEASLVRTFSEHAGAVDALKEQCADLEEQLQEANDELALIAESALGVDLDPAQKAEEHRQVCNAAYALRKLTSVRYVKSTRLCDMSFDYEVKAAERLPTAMGCSAMTFLTLGACMMWAPRWAKWVAPITIAATVVVCTVDTAVKQIRAQRMMQRMANAAEQRLELAEVRRENTVHEDLRGDIHSVGDVKHDARYQEVTVSRHCVLREFSIMPSEEKSLDIDEVMKQWHAQVAKKLDIEPDEITYDVYTDGTMDCSIPVQSKTMTISAELLVQMVGTGSMRLTRDPQDTEKAFEFFSQACKTINIDRYRGLTENIYANTVEAAMAVYLSRRAERFDLNF